MPDEEPTAEHLRARQEEESTKEHEAVLPDEAHAARRRADKAGYLAEKLEEQAEADEDA
jgi:hypothetical protein